MKQLAYKIVENVESEGLVPIGWKKENILIGFHTIPSMRPLHIHIISNDLFSPYLKVCILLLYVYVYVYIYFCVILYVLYCVQFFYTIVEKNELETHELFI